LAGAGYPGTSILLQEDYYHPFEDGEKEHEPCRAAIYLGTREELKYPSFLVE